MRLAREGAPVNAEQAYILEILAPIHEPAGRGPASSTRPGGRPLREGDDVPLPRARRGAGALRRRGRGAVLPRRGRGRPDATSSSTTAARSAAATSPPTRRSSGARSRTAFRGAEVLTNPPPSSGGILIAYSPGAAGAARTEQRSRAAGRGDGRRQRSSATSSSPRPSIARGWRSTSSIPASSTSPPPTCSARPPTSRCSTRTGCAPASPAPTAPARACWCREPGVILNNMLGEEDLNPRGFHRIRPGRAGPLDDGADRRPARRRDRARRSAAPAPTGSARRSCRRWCGWSSRGWRRRRRSARRACTSRAGVVQAEPGIDEAALARLEARGIAGRPPAGDQPLLRRRPGGRAGSGHRCPQRRRRPPSRRRRRLRVSPDVPHPRFPHQRGSFVTNDVTKEPREPFGVTDG